MDTSTSSPRSFGRFVAAAAAALTIAAAALLGGAAPASAHDELLSTDPAADSALEALPAQLTLTFSGQLLSEAGATEVQATDAAGTSLTDGTPLVQDNVVVQALTGEASGVVTVRWRTVSSDGHPISGQFGFTVSPAPAPTATATAPEPSPTKATPRAPPPAPPAPRHPPGPRRKRRPAPPPRRRPRPHPPYRRTAPRPPSGRGSSWAWREPRFSAESSTCSSLAHAGRRPSRRPLR